MLDSPFSSSLMYPHMGFGWVFVGQLWSIHPSIFWSKASRHIAQILRVSPTCSASSSASVACLSHLRPQLRRFPPHPCQIYGSLWKLKVYDMIDPNITNDIQDHASLLLWKKSKFSDIPSTQPVKSWACLVTMEEPQIWNTRMWPLSAKRCSGKQSRFTEAKPNMP